MRREKKWGLRRKGKGLGGIRRKSKVDDKKVRECMGRMRGEREKEKKNKRVRRNTCARVQRGLWRGGGEKERHESHDV